MSEPPLDVLVVGGGPSGAVTALQLARGGHSVHLVERGDYAELRVGETLPPPAYAILGELGLQPSFDAQRHGRSRVLRSAWDTAELRETNYADDPHGPWWHLDRQRFDELLSNAARDAGATVCRQARVKSLAREADSRLWRAEIATTGTETVQIRARFVVDATGRASWVARNEGASRRPYDQLVGVVGTPSTLTDQSFYTLAEATDEGWWYSALLPASRYVAIFMTDADLVPKGRSLLAAFWRHNLDKAPYTKGRLAHASPPPEPRVVSANSASLEPTCSEDWIAVGDAGLSFDPLSSLGLWHALDSACRAAYAISARLGGEDGPLTEYATEERDVFAGYIDQHIGRYERVTRWPTAPFWSRRHAWKRS